MKNIDDDYLWDRSGEPDPEIQQLEQLLGTLHYQPQPLDIPSGLAPNQRRASFPRFLAIAATIVMMLLGVGLWLGLHRQPASEVAGAKKPVVTSGGDRAPIAPPRDSSSVPRVPANVEQARPFRHRLNQGAFRHEVKRNPSPTLVTSELTAAERKEAEAAKEQLMQALRLASAKLSFAQKKAQEINSENMVHNQHKIG